MAAAGLAIGLGLALFAGKYVRSQLFGIEPDDPTTVAAAVLLLGLMGVLAAYLPTRRAVRIDPMRALRTE
jgi:ABC-type antimicrobial peptide transport system permease subunit